MSIDILTNYIISKNPTGEPFQCHATCHDLESLIWVAIYCLYRKIYHSFLHLAKDDPKRHTIVTALSTEFGEVTAEGIRTRRTNMMLHPWRSSLPGVLPFMEPVLGKLTEELLVMVRYQNDLPRVKVNTPEDPFRVRSKEIQSRLELKRIDVTCTELINQLGQSLAQCASV